MYIYYYFIFIKLCQLIKLINLTFTPFLREHMMVQRYADLKVKPDVILIIRNQKNRYEIARHEISYKKDILIKNTVHRRDISKKIAQYAERYYLCFQKHCKQKFLWIRYRNTNNDILALKGKQLN